MPDRNYWNSTFDFVGHTGYQDQFIYKYDQPLRMRFIRRVLEAFIQKDANALDIGCGSGDVIAVLREHGSRVLGIDISDAAIESTRIRFSVDSLVRVEAVDLCDWSLPDERFDVITSITVLQHIDEESLRKVLKNLRMILSPKGRLFALEIAVGRYSRSSVAINNPRERTPLEWEHIFESAGFRVASRTRYAPIGPILVQQFGRLVDALRRPKIVGESQSPAVQNSGNKKNRTLAIYDFVKRCLMISSWPLDNIFHFQLPNAVAYYQLFELEQNSSFRGREV